MRAGLLAFQGAGAARYLHVRFLWKFRGRGRPQSCHGESRESRHGVLPRPGRRAREGAGVRALRTGETLCSACSGSGIIRHSSVEGAEWRERRKRRGKTLREVARELGFTASYLCDLELGRRKWNVASRVIPRGDRVTFSATWKAVAVYCRHFHVALNVTRVDGPGRERGGGGADG
jgi:hypothetical protein